MDIKKELEEYYEIREDILKAEEEKKAMKMNNLTYAIYTFLKAQSFEDENISKDITT